MEGGLFTTGVRSALERVRVFTERGVGFGVGVLIEEGGDWSNSVWYSLYLRTHSIALKNIVKTSQIQGHTKRIDK